MVNLHRRLAGAALYRPDIDGLRALAVILVIAFHLGVNQVPGGFVGVDVFFVISGFLITSIIFDALLNNSFSFSWFYQRRIRRIFPALLTMLIISFFASFLILFPGDYKFFAQSALLSILGFSNFFFYYHSGYFDPSSKSIPLLHTWSLAVEEQFYLFWPLMMFATFRLIGFRKPMWCGLCGVIIAASFGASIWMARINPISDFYQPFTRAWELATGAFLVFLPPQRLPRPFAEGLPIAGLAAIAFATLNLSEGVPFPDLNALAPVVGSALVLYNGGRTIAATLLSCQPLRSIGKISYSLYLWHWPIIVYWKIYTNYIPLTSLSRLGIAVTTLIFAALSWRYVESPFRQVSAPRRTVFIAALTGYVCIGLLTTVSLATDGFAFRIPSAYLKYANKDEMWKWECPQHVNVGLLSYPSHTLKADSCVAGADWATARHHGIVWGDSHAEVLMPLLHPVAKKADTSVLLIPVCPAVVQQEGVRRFLPELPDYNRFCSDSRRSVLGLLSADERIDNVILAANWTRLVGVLVGKDGKRLSPPLGRRLLKEELKSLLPQIHEFGLKITVFADFPQWPPLYADPSQAPFGDPVACLPERGWLLRWCTNDPHWIPAASFNNADKPTHDALVAAAASYPYVTVYRPEDYMCDLKGLGCHAEFDGVFLYRDGDHIRRNFTTATISKFTAFLHLNELFWR